MHRDRPRVAIVDYEMGNLFSVQHACEHAGLEAMVSSSRHEIATADAVILPGVGAFADAMASLQRLDLVSVLKDAAVSGRPFLGVCLGMQLLMSQSTEFGDHEGLGLIPGVVERLESTADWRPRLKIPHVGWNQLHRTPNVNAWKNTLLDDIPDGVFMHFVHSYYVRPEADARIIATTSYGGRSFCSALAWNRIFACQAHPERSGPLGLVVYRNLAKLLCSREEPHD